MERTVPRTDSDEIELYIRTYYSLLRSSGEVAIEALVETHEGMESLLHPRARSAELDVPALVYAALRLPACIQDVRLILLGQWRAVFERWGYPVSGWQQVSAKARRRRAFFDQDETLALYIASRSDIDDIIPCLTAYQIEWNKLHRMLGTSQGEHFLSQMPDNGTLLSEDDLALLAAATGAPLEDIESLQDAWGETLVPMLKAAAHTPKRFAVRLLAGSLADYRKATRYWWQYVDEEISDIDFDEKRVYFVSSNTHSLVNLWSGYALQQRQDLIAYVEAAGHDELLAEYHDIESNAVPSSRENFLYYVLKKYVQDQGQIVQQEQETIEDKIGIRRAGSEYGFELDAQIIELGKIDPARIDPRLGGENIELLGESNALIVNIDYPLGMAAYEMLVRISENVGRIEGVYVMGKSATLNARIGDVMIPTVVHDEHSQNTYMFDNIFRAVDVAPYLYYGTVLDNQKAVSVRGTFLQNTRYMSVFYREGYTDIEMEAGPYLSAVYELIRPKRHPHDEIVSLHQGQFDIGIIHYASDRPLSKGENLGVGSLSYRGMDATYAASVAIMRQIIQREINVIRQQSQPALAS